MSKKCKNCGESFEPFMSTQKVCGFTCAVKVGKEQTEKKTEKAFKKRRQALKNRAQWLKEAQQAFNEFIRERDKGKPCISCDKMDGGGHQRHASHYRSVGACSSLRFNTWNVHASCATCNSVLSGNLIEYRIRLRLKLGDERVEWLENQNEIVRYDIEYARRVKAIFKKRTRIYRRLLR